MTLFAGVVGSPVTHSKSPLIHNYWLKNSGIAGLYLPIDGQNRPLMEVLDDPFLQTFAGFNITVPYKEQAFHLVQKRSERAVRAGSVNTIWRGGNGEWLGDSTDGFGFLENLKDHAPTWTCEGSVVAMIGAGGAARSVVAALLDGGATEIRITNRTAERASALEKQFGSRISVHQWMPTTEFFDGASLIVNSTSLGMEGQPDFDIELPKLDHTVIATDLVYAPLQTPFLIRAAAAGAITVDGLGMLLHQARPGFQHWFGKTPVVTPELREVVLTTEGYLP